MRSNAYAAGQRAAMVKLGGGPGVLRRYWGALSGETTGKARDLLSELTRTQKSKLNELGQSIAYLRRPLDKLTPGATFDPQREAVVKKVMEHGYGVGHLGETGAAETQKAINALDSAHRNQATARLLTALGLGGAGVAGHHFVTRDDNDKTKNPANSPTPGSSTPQQ